MAGLVTERRSGRFRCYSVGPTGPAQDVVRLLQALFQGFPDDLEVAAGRRCGIGTSSRSTS